MGLAIADSEMRMAQPLSTIERINRNEDMRRLRELAREQGVKQIVVISVLGALYGMLAAWRKSLRPGMIAHTMSDVVGLLWK